jgi:hypothetical protein
MAFPALLQDFIFPQIGFLFEGHKVFRSGDGEVKTAFKTDGAGHFTPHRFIHFFLA